MSSFYQHLQNEFSNLSSQRRSQTYTSIHGPPPPAPTDADASDGFDNNNSNGGSSHDAAVIVSNGVDNEKLLSTCVVDLVTCQTELFPEVYPLIQKAMCEPPQQGYYMNQLSLTDVTYKSRLNGNDGVIERLPVQFRHVNANIVSTKNKNGDGNGAVSTSSSIGNSVSISDPYCQVYIVTMDDAEEYKGITKPLLKKWVAQKEKSGEQYIIMYVDYVAPSEEMELQNGKGKDVVNNDTSATGATPPIGMQANLTAAFQRARMLHVDVGNKLARDQQVKELFRKLSYDFGASKTCMISTVDFKEGAMEKFLSQLSQAIVCSFDNRTHHLDEELRAMLNVRIKSKGQNWNFANFFLAKERLAYTFEHMQLEKEALLQYEELGAFIYSESKLPTAQSLESEPVKIGSEENNVNNFMLRLSANQVTDQELYQRLFERESHFLFLLSRPLQALLLSRQFIVSTYKRFLGNSNISKMDAEMFAFQSCWELHEVSKDFFDLTNDEIIVNESESLCKNEERNEASRFMSSILEFGRRRLLNAAKEAGLSSNIIMRAKGTCPHQTLANWSSWDELNQMSKNVAKEHGENSCLVIGDSTSWVKKSLSSIDSYEDTYLKVSLVMVQHSRRNGFMRTTLQHQNECAEIFILKERYEEAAGLLQDMINNRMLSTCWDRLYSWLLFRFACCQRLLKTPQEYLPTLIHSFNPRLASVAPTIALDYLLSDLETIVLSNDVDPAKAMHDLFPFLETTITVCPTTEGRRTSLNDKIHKRLTTHRCEVGESVEISCKFLSYFPRDIHINEIHLGITKLSDLDMAQEKSEIFCSLSIDGPIKVEPGENELKFKWVPLNMDSFVICNVSLKWGNAEFVLGLSSGLFPRKPVQGFEVIQSTPTQKIELGQLPFLLPGEKQELLCTYKSGEDHIEGGTIEFSCSKGIEIMPPSQEDNSEWCKNIRLPIEKCEPGHVANYCIHVKAMTDISSLDEVKVSVTTTFLHGCHLDVECKDEPPSDAMECHLEGLLHIQTCLGLELSSCKVFAFEELSVFNVSLYSGAPVAFTIKDWHPEISPPYILEDNGNLSADLFYRSILPGEEVWYGFQCIHAPHSSSDNSNITLTVQLLDEFGRTHSQAIPLNFNEDGKEDKGKLGAGYLTVSLQCEPSEGQVGSPVKFSCSINASEIDCKEGIAYGYAINYDTSDWIISGKINGVLEINDKASLSFVGIPIRSGSLSKFPQICIDTPPDIRVFVKEPENFKSIPYLNHVALAFCKDDVG